MPDQEKNILDALDAAVKDVEIPSSLHPENIQKMLENTGNPQHSFRRKSSGRSIWRHQYGYALAAAMLILVIGGGAVWQLGHSSSPNFSDMVSSERTAADKAENTVERKKDSTAESQIASAETYDEIYDYVNTYYRAVNRSGGQQKLYGGGDAESRAFLEYGSFQSNSGMKELAGTKTSDFSDTNVRTEGVGESDIVKTDGSYLYVLKESGQEIAIIDIRSDRMKPVAVIKNNDDRASFAQGYICEFYVTGSKVFLFSSGMRTSLTANGFETHHNELRMQVFDVTDIKNPKLTDTVTQSGYYITSRFVDGYLYLVSEFEAISSLKSDRETYIPMVNGELLREDCIYIPEEQAANRYMVVVSVKLDDPGRIVDQKAVLSEDGKCYVSSQNIYIYEGNSILYGNSPLYRTDPSDRNQTRIRRLFYKNGILTGEAQGKINGRLNDSFSLDEYNGTLRAVTTENSSGSSSNSVFVLDKDLKIIGKITNLARGEQVYSARFFGSTGYFVTFRQTDPLFSVDFSDPTNPRIIGTLKIPGFSEYLHFYGDGLLLGIGMDADEKSGATSGVKIAMFDISDPSDVKELHKYLIKGAHYSDVFYDYRAVLIDHKKNMIGFSAYGNQDNYYIFSYDKVNGFHVEMKEEINGIGGTGTRGLYIGERFYVVRGNTVESYRMKGFEKVDDLVV